MSGERYNQNISLKANRVLNLILMAFVLILLRIWHLAFIQYDKKVEESQKPQRRTVMIPSKRGTIRDRFNMPLAINTIKYNAAILYSHLRQIPSVKWEFDANGKKVKKYKRKEYIASLSKILGEELDLSAERIEDLIHSKAALYYNIPFVIKEDLDERQYYRLKMLEKDWVGLQTQIASKRRYPQGRSASDILGYMGAINREEYEEVLQEISCLKTYLKENEEGLVENYPIGIENEEQARERLKKLKGFAYGINDYIGKSGTEGRFEQELRGCHGKKNYYADAKGNYLKELPGSRPPLSGQRLLLTLSIELQEYCEKLLAQNERIRQARLSVIEGVDAVKQALLALRQPWIKGGAVLAMDPKTGEVLAMASYPRFDPNDFVVTQDPILKKQRLSNIGRWFESESYIAEIWDQKRPLEREFYNDENQTFYDEGKWLTWDFYLERILPASHEVIQKLKLMGTVQEAIHLQAAVEKLVATTAHANLSDLLSVIFHEEQPTSKGSKALKAETKSAIEKKLQMHKHALQPLIKKLEVYFNSLTLSYNKVLLVDLCQLAVNKDLFSPELLSKVGSQSLHLYRQASSAKTVLMAEIKPVLREIFHEHSFKVWRQQNEKDFLKQKREEEKQQKFYAKPYIDYLDAEENRQFDLFWQENALSIALLFLRGKYEGDASLNPYRDYFQSLHTEIASGAHSQASWIAAYHTLQKAVEGLDTPTAIDYLKTLRGYSQLNRPLYGQYRMLRKDNGKHYEKHLAAAFYPVNGYGYGRSQVYRQAAQQGSIFKLIPAYAALKKKYDSLPPGTATDTNLNPLSMTDQVFKIGKEPYVGYLENGQPLPKKYKGGRLPRSGSSHIGKLEIIKAIDTSSNPYFSLLAGDYLTPEELIQTSQQFSFGVRTGIDLPGEIAGKLPQDLLTNKTGLYAFAIGQHSLVVTPLQTGVMLSALANGGEVLKPQIIKSLVGKPMSFENRPLESAPKKVQRLDDQQDIYMYTFPKAVQKVVFLPEVIRRILLEGMRRVVIRTQKDGLASLSRFYRDYPEAISDYIDLKHDLVGKTSTAESMEHIDLDLENGTNMYKHVWFGGIAFAPESEHTFVAKDASGNPELVVVVYLKFGVYGKEAAPMAAQVVSKWRAIKAARLGG